MKSDAQIDAAFDRLAELLGPARPTPNHALDRLPFLLGEQRAIPARAHEHFAPQGAGLGLERAAFQWGVAVGLLLARFERNEDAS